MAYAPAPAVENLFEPVIIPTFYDHINYGPEHDLLGAMIDRAITDLICPTVAQQDRRDAYHWLLLSNEQGRWSLSWVCSHLDLDEEGLRSKIKAHIEKPIKLAA